MKRTNSLMKNGIFALIFIFSSLFSFTQTTFPVSGNPLESVTVQVKGTGVTTVTRVDGSFSITAPSGNAVLAISSVCFTSQELNISNRAAVTFSMAPPTTSCRMWLWLVMAPVEEAMLPARQPL